MSSKETKRIEIQALARHGVPTSEIAKQLQVNYRTAKKWSQRMDHKHNYNTIQEKKLTPNTKRRISAEMKEKIGSSLRKCSKKLNLSENYKMRNKTISYSSVNKYLKSTEWGKLARKLRTKPLLSNLNVQNRLSFALEVQKDGYCDKTRLGRDLRKNILWTDESPIELNPKPNKQNTRVRSSNREVSVVGIPKFPLKVMVAGGITASGVTELYICDSGEIINGKVYEEKILPIYLSAINNPKLIPNKRKATFMQDSAPAHNIRPVIEKIESTFPESWTQGFWPGNSPDFNVIEPVWGVLQESVFEKPTPRNREELIQRIKNKWSNLSPDYLTNLVESFPKRVEEAINNEGGHTNY
jgi:transposase